MEMGMKRIANECFFAWVESEIKSGRSVKFRVKGNSMMPLLRNGKDEVVVGPYDKEELKLFDVILFRQTDRYVLHRIIQKRDSRYLMQGDGVCRFYEECELPLYYNGDLVGLEDIRGIKERFPGLAGIMLGRGLLASPWLATEFVSGQVLTVNERRDKLVMFHESLMDEYAARLEGGEHQVLSKMKTIWDYLLPEADKRLRKKVLKSTSLTSYQSAVKDLLSL